MEYVVLRVVMARKKVKLEWIANDGARRATFKKRRKGLMKKVSELSTLCDVKACLIVYGPNEAAAEVWPSVPEAVRVLAKLKRMPEMEQSKKMMNQEGFMRQRIAKLQEQLRKQDRENRELETTLLMYRSMMAGKGGGLEGLGIEEVTSLAWLVEMKLGEVRKRMEEGVPPKDQPPALPAPAQASAPMKQEPQGPTSLEAQMVELQGQEWFTELMNMHHDPLIFRGGDVGYPYVDHVNIAAGNCHAWPEAYFHLN